MMKGKKLEEGERGKKGKGEGRGKRKREREEETNKTYPILHNYIFKYPTQKITFISQNISVNDKYSSQRTHCRR